MAAINTYIALYTTDPTEGQKDGSLVSKDGEGTAPLAVTLNATENESKVVKCALRCADGYKTSGNTILSFEGTTSGYWTASLSESTGFSSSLSISDVIEDTNKIIYIKASSASVETPQNDTSVSIKIVATIQAKATE